MRRKLQHDALLAAGGQAPAKGRAAGQDLAYQRPLTHVEGKRLAKARLQD